MTFKSKAAVAVLLPIAFIGCQRPEQAMAPGASETAAAELAESSGKAIGQAHFMQTQGGVDMHLTVSDLEPGPHALHIHEKGVCEPPDFASAGGHFNPTNVQHGFDVEGGPHLGDLRNLEVGENGQAETQRSIPGVSLTGEHSILGLALVIHSGPDDYTSQPSGAAGGRVACGVIEKSTSAPNP
jgi:Cu-Zn family superoxide dismutase